MLTHDLVFTCKPIICHKWPIYNICKVRLFISQPKTTFISLRTEIWLIICPDNQMASVFKKNLTQDCNVFDNLCFKRLSITVQSIPDRFDLRIISIHGNIDKYWPLHDLYCRLFANAKKCVIYFEILFDFVKIALKIS